MRVPLAEQLPPPDMVAVNLAVTDVPGGGSSWVKETWISGPPDRFSKVVICPEPKPLLIKIGDVLVDVLVTEYE